MKLFAVCYYAPPKLTPQAIQIGRQLYHLDADVALLYGRDAQFGDNYDQYPDFFKRIRGLEVANPGPLLKGLALRAWRRLVPVYGNLPDAFGPWRRKALAPALAELKSGNYDAIVSFGMPMSDHLLAYELKRRTGLPWLVHFSDPWTRNPFHQHGPFARRVNESMERKVIEAADQVLFTSQLTLELVMAQYPDSWRAKCAVLPHAWDMDNFAGPAKEPKPRPAGVPHIVRHIGACYGARSPVPLFAALARIHERTPQILDGVCFEFVGYVAPAAMESDAYKSLPPGLVELRGQVGYRESLDLAQSASALLVIDAPSEQPSVFLPSKLVEYIGAGRPVWGITPPGTASNLIAEWAGGAHACAAPGDIEAIARMLMAGLKNLTSLERGATGGPEQVQQRFAPARVAGALRQHLQAAIAHRAAPAASSSLLAG